MIKSMRRYASPRVFLWAFALLLLLPASGAGVAEGRPTRVAGIAEVNGTKLYYEMMGKGRTVVLIHGGFVDSRLWDDQFGELAKRYTVLRYDLRNCGKSAFSMGPYSHVEDLYALLKFLKIDNASFVGLSLGSIIAEDFTLEHPEMVNALVLASPGLRGHPSAKNKQALEISKAAETQPMETVIDMWLAHPYFATGRNNPAYTRRMRAMLADNYRYWGPTPSPILETWPTRPTFSRLSEIKVPTLIIVGQQDAPNIGVVADTLASGIAGARKVVIAGVSHHLNMEKPKEFNKVVLDFLRSRGAAAQGNGRGERARPPTVR